ncbi:hypothetical protein RSAG8_02349, partial [Rhizoctonia solani AG-8 WAC10335]
MLVMESILLCFFSHMKWINSKDNNIRAELLLVFTYLGLFMSLGATFGLHLLLHLGGGVYAHTSQRASWNVPGDPTVNIDAYPGKLPETFGAGKARKPLVYYVWFTSSSLYLCMLAQVLLFIWGQVPLPLL